MVVLLFSPRCCHHHHRPPAEDHTIFFHAKGYDLKILQLFTSNYLKVKGSEISAYLEQLNHYSFSQWPCWCVVPHRVLQKEKVRSLLERRGVSDCIVGDKQQRKERTFFGCLELRRNAIHRRAYVSRDYRRVAHPLLSDAPARAFQFSNEALIISSTCLAGEQQIVIKTFPRFQSPGALYSVSKLVTGYIKGGDNESVPLAQFDFPFFPEVNLKKTLRAHNAG